MYPSQALFDSGGLPEPLPSCDHYAGKERFIRKILPFQQQSDLVFDVTLDLEDGAELGAPNEQQEMIREALQSEAARPERRGIRLHPVTDPLFRVEVEDFLPSVHRFISYVTIPKVRDIFEASSAIKLLNAVARANRFERPLQVQFLIECPTVLPHAATIAALRFVRALDFGLMDFVSSFGGAISSSAIVSPGQFENHHVINAKRLIVEAAAGAGKVASHNVTTAFNDPDQTFKDATFAKERFGFSRMWSIHPSQIEPIVTAFAPSEAELEIAKELLLAAKKANWGPIQFRSKLHDRASYRYYWGILYRSWLSGGKLEKTVQQELFGDLTRLKENRLET